MTTTTRRPLQPAGTIPPAEPEQVRARRPKALATIGTAFAIVVFVLLSLTIGSGGVTFGALVDVIGVVISGAQVPSDLETSYQIVTGIRAPRILLALLGGGLLSLAGVILQGFLRNPLVSPFTLGVSPAAAFGAALVIYFTANGVTAFSGLEVFFALIFGLASIVLVIGLSGGARSFGVTTLILFGIAISQLFSALTAALQYVSSDNATAAIVRWNFGTVNNATWPQVVTLAILSVVVFPYFLYHAKSLNAIAFAGDDYARTLGIKVDRARIIHIFLAVAITSVIVSFSGVIGFVGLVGPHIARFIVGSDHRVVYPFAFASGGLLLLGADLIGRNIIAPAIVPVGIIISFIGVPLFIYLILRGRKRA